MIATCQTDASIHHLGQIELARRWGVSPRTLERWRSVGEGPTYIKVGWRVVYRLQDIEGFEHQQARAAHVAPRHDINFGERSARGLPE